ncbi:MAG: LURP-one-related family protein [Kitasatospora sp.]|jgi:uncharacterized protein YxjI|nr:LURP-one-related family protein [Kitasatospora sp.]
MRYLVRERFLAVGEDFWIEDEHGDRAFLVDGKAMRVRDTFELKDPAGAVLLVIRQKLVSLRPAMTIEQPGGKLVATVRKKRLTVLRERYRAELADGSELDIKGNVIDKEFDIEYEGERLARISKKWFRVRDTYAVDVARDDADPALLIACAVSVDSLEERLARRKD